MPYTDPREIQERLAEPFPEEVIGWKAQATTKDGKKALAVPYIDARDVQDRLDAVLGIDGWESHVIVLPTGGVLCTLRLRIGDHWVEKTDAGGQSDQPDDGDKLKAAVSDSLKRAAVQAGIGRYLYRIPQSWCAYDGQRRQLTETPKLPAWALPAKAAPTPPPTKEAPKQNGAPGGAKPGVAFFKAIRERGAEMATTGACSLVSHTDYIGPRVRPGEPMETWTEEDVKTAWQHAADFEQEIITQELARTNKTWEQVLQSQTAQDFKFASMLRKNLGPTQRLAIIKALRGLPPKKQAS